MGRISDTVAFANAGYVDVRQTTLFVDGLGRPIQTVIQGNRPRQQPGRYGYTRCI